MAASTGTVSFFVVYDWSKALTAERTEPSEARLRMTAQFTADGKLKLPVGFRRWVFLGAPLTPNVMQSVAENVRGGGAISASGHRVIEEQPETLRLGRQRFSN